MQRATNRVEVAKVTLRSYQAGPSHRAGWPWEFAPACVLAVVEHGASKQADLDTADRTRNERIDSQHASSVRVRPGAGEIPR